MSQLSPSQDAPGAPATADRLVETLRTTRLTVVVGAAGSGKTRLLTDGVLHRLRRRVDDLAAAAPAPAGPQGAGPVERRRRTVRPRELVVFCDRWDGSPEAQVHACLDAAVGVPAGDGGRARLPVALRAKALSAERAARLLFVFDHGDRLEAASPDGRDPAAEYDALVNALCSVSPSVHLLLSARDGALPPSVQSRLGSPDTCVVRLPAPKSGVAATSAADTGPAPSSRPDVDRPLHRDDVYASIADRLTRIGERTREAPWGSDVARPPRPVVAEPATRAATGVRPGASPAPIEPGAAAPPGSGEASGNGAAPVSASAGPGPAPAALDGLSGSSDPAAAAAAAPPFQPGSFARAAAARRSRGARRAGAVALAAGLVVVAAIGTVLWLDREGTGALPDASERRVDAGPGVPSPTAASGAAAGTAPRPPDPPTAKVASPAPDGAGSQAAADPARAAPSAAVDPARAAPPAAVDPVLRAAAAPGSAASQVTPDRGNPPPQTAVDPGNPTVRAAADPGSAALSAAAGASNAAPAAASGPPPSEDPPVRVASNERAAEAPLADELWQAMSRHGVARLGVPGSGDPVDALSAGRRLAVVPYDTLRTLASSRGVARTARVVAPLFTEEIHVVVRADSALAFIHQIAGRRVDFGPAQGARHRTALAFYRRLFDRAPTPAETSGADLDTALAQLLGGGPVDAIVLAEPQPSAWLARLPAAQQRRLKLLTVAPDDPSTRRALRSYLPATVRAPAGIAGPAVRSFAVMTFLVANPATPVGRDDTAAVAARALCLSLPELRRGAHPKWREVDPALRLPVPLAYDPEASAIARGCDAPGGPPAVAESAADHETPPKGARQ